MGEIRPFCMFEDKSLCQRILPYRNRGWYRLRKSFVLETLMKDAQLCTSKQSSIPSDFSSPEISSQALSVKDEGLFDANDHTDRSEDVCIALRLLLYDDMLPEVFAG